MIHQLRIYEIFEPTKQAFHDRFRDHATRIMRNYGFSIIAMWETQTAQRTECVYLLAWPDVETMRNAWAQFMADAEWQAIKRSTGAEHGALVGAIEDRVLMPVSYATSGVALRRARTNDAPVIAAVFDAAVRTGWSYLGEGVQTPMFTLKEWEETLMAYAEPHAFLVATDVADTVLGFVAAHTGEGEVFLLFTHPHHAGRGIGRMLLAAAEDALRAAGCAGAFLFTHEQNERAQAVYRAAGYHTDGSLRESTFRGIALREVRLVKAL